MNNENNFNNDLLSDANENQTPDVLEEATPVLTSETKEEIIIETEADSEAEETTTFPEDNIETNPYLNNHTAPQTIEDVTTVEATPAESAPPVYTPPVYNPPVYNPPVYNTPPAEPRYTQPQSPYQYQQTPPQNPQTPQNQYYNPPKPPVQQPTYYYQQPPVAPTPPEKKKGSNVLLIILWILVGLFALGFFGMCGYIIGGGSDSSKSNIESSDIPTLFSEDNKNNTEVPDNTEKDETPDKDNNVVPLPEGDKDLYSNNTKITLNPIPQDHTDKAKYTTQYAYKTVAESTIGVVCYENGFASNPASQGTGIIVSKDGYIITNSHVIGDSRSLYYVQIVTNDGTIYEAKIIGYDSRTDLAVLKVNANNLTPANFCDSKYVEVGQDVIAVGNPGGIEFQNTLTRGVVSALNRELSLSSQVAYIQTDAAINPGNSGGPLCNIYGQVIGINTAKISASSYEGMGFAIPSATVKDIVDDLISKGYVENRVRLGISGTEVNISMQQYYQIPAGILIGEISKDGPCYNKGIETNDIITAIDDTEITSFSDIYAVLAKHKPGDKVTISVYKTRSGKTVEIAITLMADQGESQQ